MALKMSRFWGTFCSTIIHSYICKIDSGFFFSASNNSPIVRKFLQSCQKTVILTGIEAISSNSSYDSLTIMGRIIWNYSTCLFAF